MHGWRDEGRDEGTSGGKKGGTKGGMKGGTKRGTSGREEQRECVCMRERREHVRDEHVSNHQRPTHRWRRSQATQVSNSMARVHRAGDEDVVVHIHVRRDVLGGVQRDDTALPHSHDRLHRRLQELALDHVHEARLVQTLLRNKAPSMSSSQSPSSLPPSTRSRQRHARP
jgi:hypothetical protein